MSIHSTNTKHKQLQDKNLLVQFAEGDCVAFAIAYQDLYPDATLYGVYAYDCSGWNESDDEDNEMVLAHVFCTFTDSDWTIKGNMGIDIFGFNDLDKIQGYIENICTGLEDFTTEELSRDDLIRNCRKRGSLLKFNKASYNVAKKIIMSHPEIYAPTNINIQEATTLTLANMLLNEKNYSPMGNFIQLYDILLRIFTVDNMKKLYPVGETLDGFVNNLRKMVELIVINFTRAFPLPVDRVDVNCKPMYFGEVDAKPKSLRLLDSLAGYVYFKLVASSAQYSSAKYKESAKLVKRKIVLDITVIIGEALNLRNDFSCRNSNETVKAYFRKYILKSLSSESAVRGFGSELASNICHELTHSEQYNLGGWKEKQFYKKDGRMSSRNEKSNSPEIASDQDYFSQKNEIAAFAKQLAVEFARQGYTADAIKSLTQIKSIVENLSDGYWSLGNTRKQMPFGDGFLAMLNGYYLTGTTDTSKRFIKVFLYFLNAQ
jgi:hypothetical protein